MAEPFADWLSSASRLEAHTNVWKKCRSRRWALFDGRRMRWMQWKQRFFLFNYRYDRKKNLLIFSLAMTSFTDSPQCADHRKKSTGFATSPWIRISARMQSLPHWTNQRAAKPIELILYESRIQLHSHAWQSELLHGAHFRCFFSRSFVRIPIFFERFKFIAPKQMSFVHFVRGEKWTELSAAHESEQR